MGLRNGSQFLSDGDYTPEVKQLVTKLRSQEKLADRIYAEAVAEGLMKAVTRGLKPATGSKGIDRLLGKRPGPGKERRLLGEDHTSVWCREGKAQYLVTQPYGLSWKSLKALVEFCKVNGLRVEVSADLSWHFPGRTLAVVVSHDDPSVESLPVKLRI